MRWVSLLLVAPALLVCATSQAQGWPPAPSLPPASSPTPWYGPPSRPPPPEPAPPAAERGADGSGLMIGGALTWALYYGASALSTAGLGEACDYQPAAAQMQQLEQLHEAGQLDDEQLAVAQAAKLCDRSRLNQGYIPFAGPFLTIASLKGTPLSVWPLQVGLASLGVGQITGAILFLTGAVQRAHAEPEPAVQVLPSVGPSSASMSVAVRF